MICPKMYITKMYITLNISWMMIVPYVTHTPEFPCAPFSVRDTCTRRDALKMKQSNNAHAFKIMV